MDKPKMEAVASALVMVAESAALAARQLEEALAAYEEATLREAIAQIEEDEKCDHFAELLQSMEDIRRQYMLDELAEDPADLEAPKKILRPPRRLGPVNKTNHAASRPPRRARSSCYRCHH